MMLEEKAQREIIRLLNKWSEGYETELLEQFADWTNENFLSLYKIVQHENNWYLLNRQTNESIDKK